jgi:hypothetical protein
MWSKIITLEDKKGEEEIKEEGKRTRKKAARRVLKKKKTRGESNTKNWHGTFFRIEIQIIEEAMIVALHS